MMNIKDKKLASDITKEERKRIGCKAFSGISPSQIADENKINREFVYQQKQRVKELLERGEQTFETQVIELERKKIEQIVIGCMLFCKGSLEDTQRFCELILNRHLSIGKISAIINEAADKAAKWNETIDLSTIKTGANDEIFQGSKPVLVGVDPETTFTYLMQETENRDSTTWGYHLLTLEQKQGLHLETAITDGGTGLRKGVKEAYPEITPQLDVFHTEYDFSKATLAAEREAYRRIEQEEKLRRKTVKKDTLETRQKIEEAQAKTTQAIFNYDLINLLYRWIVELLQMGGYFYSERMEILDFIIQQLELVATPNAYLQKALKFLKENKRDILQFVKKAEIKIEKLAVEENVPPEALMKIWQQQRYSFESSEYNYLEAEIGILLGIRYDEVHKKWAEAMGTIFRASSIVECINSLIRPYLFLKKAVPGKFLSLLQFYFNTRKYRRSGKAERVGKSPVELITGLTYDNPLELLG